MSNSTKKATEPHYITNRTNHVQKLLGFEIYELKLPTKRPTKNSRKPTVYKLDEWIQFITFHFWTKVTLNVQKILGKRERKRNELFTLKNCYVSKFSWQGITNQNGRFVYYFNHVVTKWLSNNVNKNVREHKKKKLLSTSKSFRNHRSNTRPRR